MAGSYGTDSQLENAAQRRHARVHASSSASTCPECLTETRMAAADLLVPNLWRALDDLWATVIRSRETKSPATADQVLPNDAALRGTAPE